MATIASGERVRAGLKAYYYPGLWDVADPPFGEREGWLHRGDLVEIFRCNGCPPPGTMGMAHIRKNGRFAGLVMTSSLTKEPPHDELEDVYGPAMRNGAEG